MQKTRKVRNAVSCAARGRKCKNSFCLALQEGLLGHGAVLQNPQ